MGWELGGLLWIERAFCKESKNVVSKLIDNRGLCFGNKNMNEDSVGRSLRVGK